MDLTIPYNICPTLKADLDNLLAIAEAHTNTPSSHYKGVSYVKKAIARRSRSSSPEDRARITKAARVAARKARNDGRVRGAPPLVQDQDLMDISDDGGTHSRVEVPLAQQMEEGYLSSDSDIPLSQKISSGATGPSGAPSVPPVQTSAGSRWQANQDSRPTPEPVRRLILLLSLSRNQECRKALAALQQQLASESFTVPTSFPPTATTLRDLANQCQVNEKNTSVLSYVRMRTLMQFALWVDHFNGHGEISNKKVAKKHGISQRMMRRFYPVGAKLAYFALSGSPYLFVLLALIKERYNVCHDLTPDQICTFGVQLRELSQDQSEGVLLRSRVLPDLQDMMENCRGPAFTIPLPTGETLNFWDMVQCDEVLGKIHYKVYKVVDRSDIWHIPCAQLPAPGTAEGYLPSHTVPFTLPISIDGLPCPVKEGKSSARWTNKEREKAKDAIEVKSLRVLM